MYSEVGYANKEEEEGKKKIHGLDRSVRWSEELSFRACLPFTKSFRKTRLKREQHRTFCVVPGVKFPEAMELLKR